MRNLTFKSWRIPVALLLVMGLTLFILACSEEDPTATATTAAPAAPAATATPTEVAAVGAYPEAGVGGIPSSVAKATIAVDHWGADHVNPWAVTTGVPFFQDLFNLRIMMNDTDGSTVPLWATEYELTNDGIRFQLNPNAKFQDGNPADAQALADNFRAFMGEFIGTGGYTEENRTWNGSQIEDAIDSMEVISPTELYIKTSRPYPHFMENFGGTAYHLIFYGNPNTAKQGIDAYEDNPAGGGPYSIKEFKPNERIVFERWEGFWADYPWYKKPQAETLELLAAPDHAARYALLVSEQVDMVYNVPWNVAKDLTRSEATQRGVNPGGTDIWTQTYKANGHLNMNFNLPVLNRVAATVTEGDEDAGGVKIRIRDVIGGYDDDPTLDARVREALNLAIDKRTVSATSHFGLSIPTGSIFSPGSFGHRTSVEASPYDPERAMELLTEAGYPDGFEITGHFGQFAGRPGIVEMTDAIVSYWAAIGVKAEMQEHHPNEFAVCTRDLQCPQVTFGTYGRQEHSSVRLNDSYHSTANWLTTWDPEVDRLFFKATGSTDVDTQLSALAEVEDHILSLNETFPLYAMSLQMGYTDRVLAHPTVEFSPHFKNLDRLVFRD